MVKTQSFITIVTMLMAGSLCAQITTEDADHARRAALTEELVRARQSVGRTLDPAYRDALISRFERETVEQLEQRRTDGNLPIAATALGQFGKDMTYTTLQQPCRIIDTRAPLAGGPLASSEVRPFQVQGTFDFEGQGGTPGGCGIPYFANAAMINFVAVNPSGGGNLKGAAYPNAMPGNGSILNYQQTTPTLNLANGLLFPLCDLNGPVPCTWDISVQANGASTHLVADVIGYTMKFPKEKFRRTVVENFLDSTTKILTTCRTFPGYVEVSAPVGVPGKVWARATVDMTAWQRAPLATNGSEYEVYLTTTPDYCFGEPTTTSGNANTKTMRRRGEGAARTGIYFLLDNLYPIDGGTSIRFYVTMQAFHEQTGDESFVQRVRMIAEFVPD